MYAFSLENAPSNLRPGVLTRFYTENYEDSEKDEYFNDVLKNGEKKIREGYQKLKKTSEIEADIKKYNNILHKIYDDAGFYLSEKDLPNLFDQIIGSKDNENENENAKNNFEEEEVDEEEDEEEEGYEDEDFKSSDSE